MVFKATIFSLLAFSLILNTQGCKTGKNKKRKQNKEITVNPKCPEVSSLALVEVQESVNARTLRVADLEVQNNEETVNNKKIRVVDITVRKDPRADLVLLKTCKGNTCSTTLVRDQYVAEDNDGTLLKTVKGHYPSGNYTVTARSCVARNRSKGNYNFASNINGKTYHCGPEGNKARFVFEENTREVRNNYIAKEKAWDAFYSVVNNFQNKAGKSKNLALKNIANTGEVFADLLKGQATELVAKNQKVAVASPSSFGLSGEEGTCKSPEELAAETARAEEEAKQEKIRQAMIDAANTREEQKAADLAAAEKAQKDKDAANAKKMEKYEQDENYVDAKRDCTLRQKADPELQWSCEKDQKDNWNSCCKSAPSITRSLGTYDSGSKTKPPAEPVEPSTPAAPVENPGMSAGQITGAVLIGVGGLLAVSAIAKAVNQKFIVNTGSWLGASSKAGKIRNAVVTGLATPVDALGRGFDFAATKIKQGSRFVGSKITNKIEGPRESPTNNYEVKTSDYGRALAVGIAGAALAGLGTWALMGGFDGDDSIGLSGGDSLNINDHARRIDDSLNAARAAGAAITD